MVTHILILNLLDKDQRMLGLRVHGASEGLKSMLKEQENTELERK